MTRRDRGSATVELAVSLPGLVLLLFVALAAVMAVRAQLQCVDAAREGALVRARGGDGIAAASRLAPNGAVITVAVAGDTAQASVRVRVAPLGDRLPGVTVTGSAAAVLEPGPL